MAETIIYEQPLNEHLRVCLRLEYLFGKVKHNLQDESSLGSRQTLSALMEIINIVDRPDLKTKLTRALGEHAVNLANLEQSPNVDSKKLKEILSELDRLADTIHRSQGKLGQPLRENEFLNNIRLHEAKPGGACDFSCPAYYFWLQQPAEQRGKSLLKWLQVLEPVQTSVALLLQLTRESAGPQLKFAAKGFYQETLDLATPYQIIRVILSPERKVFPEISVGRHRLSIHFLSPNFEGRAVQVTHDIQFKLACCAI